MDSFTSKRNCIYENVSISFHGCFFNKFIKLTLLPLKKIVFTKMFLHTCF